jgi:hypothetical protein
MMRRSWFLRSPLGRVALSLGLSLPAAVVLSSTLAGGAAYANQYNVAEVPKLISARDAGKLRAVGITMTDDILHHAATAIDRKTLAKRSGLRAARVEQLARYADLLRLENIGPEWVILLEASGIRSIPDLATRDPAALTKKVAAVNRTRRIANPAPTEAQVGDWVTQAGKLAAVLIPA